MKTGVILLILSAVTVDALAMSLHPPLATDRSCLITRSAAFGVIDTFHPEGSKPHNCTWVIKTPPGSKVELHFPYLQLSELQNCTKESDTDHLLISRAEVEPIFLCYNRFPLLVNTDTSTVNITLHVRNETTSKAQFRLFWRIVDGTNCSQDFSEPTGVIMSPNYPNEIPTAVTCVYNITAPKGFVIRLRVSHLAIQTLASDSDVIIPAYRTDCINSLLIRDAGVQSPQTIRHFCDKDSHFPGLVYQSTNNHLWMQFHTYHPLRRQQGFVAVYDTVPEKLASDTFQHSNNCTAKPHVRHAVVTSHDVHNKDHRYYSPEPDHTNCSREFHEQSGVIMSPNYPNGTDSAVFCIYKIIQLPGTIIRFSLTHFNVQNSTDKIAHNYLEIRDGSSESLPLIKIIKEKHNFILQPPIKSKNSMLIKFVTSGPVGQNEGFHAVYDTLPENSKSEHDDSFCIYTSKDDN